MDVFEKSKDDADEARFKASLMNDVQGMLNLFEAAYLAIHREDILDEAIVFTTTHLKSMKDEDDGIVKEKSEIAPIYVENNPEDSDSSETALEHEEHEPVESEALEARRSTCERRPPSWHSEHVTKINVAYCLLTED
ncbi:beta-cubebene synthase-like [Citrus clementina]|uniref:beta-cubebene synthase-like n=1 Tax=Citrus clementina TaxID=85681 RepID=UPI000CECF85A|nr:beta-cubebene synthase-like [Citrus x clementina]